MTFVRLMLIGVIPVLVLAGCSREQTDWKTAQAADTIEAYGDFLRKHSDAAEAPDARVRIEQLGEQRDWQRASTSDTREAYAQFIALHPNSQWTQEARIRIENFALGPVPASKPPAPASADTPVVAPATAPKAPVVAAQPTAPKPAAPKPTAAPVVSGHKAKIIQLGAFNSDAIAHDQWTRLVKKHAELAHLEPRTEAVSRGRKTLYRLRTTAPDAAAADRICAALKRGNDACLAVADQR